MLAAVGWWRECGPDVCPADTGGAARPGLSVPSHVTVSESHACSDASETKESVGFCSLYSTVFTLQTSHVVRESSHGHALSRSRRWGRHSARCPAPVSRLRLQRPTSNRPTRGTLRTHRIPLRLTRESSVDQFSILCLLDLFTTSLLAPLRALRLAAICSLRRLGLGLGRRLALGHCSCCRSGRGRNRLRL